MKQTILQELTAKIAAVVPEILELKFGCRIIEQGTGRDFTVIGSTPDGDPITIDSTGVYKPLAPAGASVEKIESKKLIIGRPVTLEDVLRAIHTKDSYAVGSDGRFILGDKWVNEKNGILALTWKIGKPLSDQNLPTLEFINNLLS